jgi:hypothetical protein
MLGDREPLEVVIPRRLVVEIRQGVVLEALERGALVVIGEARAAACAELARETARART